MLATTQKADVIEVEWEPTNGAILATASVQIIPKDCHREAVASTPNPNPFNPLAEILVWGLLAALATGFIGCVWYAIAYLNSPQRTIEGYQSELLDAARAAQTAELNYKALVTEVESKGLNPSEIAPYATTLMTEECQ
jgi:hypothetical protein